MFDDTQSDYTPRNPGCGFHNIETLESLLAPLARDDTRFSYDAAIIAQIETLDDAGAIDLLDSLNPCDAKRIAHKMGA